MSLNKERSGPSIQSLIKELCRHMCPGLDPSVAARTVKKCLSIITSHDCSSSFNNSLSDNDEFALVEKIKDRLQATGSETTALEFDALHRKLITVSHNTLKNRAALFTLFLKLSESESSSTNGNKELGRIVSQQSFDSSLLLRIRAGADTSMRSPSFRGLPTSTKQSSVESINWASGLPREHVISMNVNTDRRLHRTSDRYETITRSSTVGDTITRPSSVSQKCDTFTRPSTVGETISRHSSLGQTPPSTPRSQTGKYEVSEIQMLRELLFCFQGIEGNILRLDADSGFKIDPLAIVSQPHLVRSLMEMGYLHNYVTGLCQQLEEGGAVARGLTTAIRAQLTEYYCRVAQLQCDLKQSVSLMDDSPMCEETQAAAWMTLRRLLVWMREPRWQFQVLADMCRVCASQRGGAIISAAYPYSYHGSPIAQKIAISILAAAARPLFTLMCHWMCEGDLYDPHDEFFVGVNKMCSSHNRWKDKFFLRKELVPAVMTEKQAMMVVSAGRCINFLNEICTHKMEVTGARAKLRQMQNSEGGEFLQLAEPASPLAIIIEAACMEASQLVLDTLKTQFKLFDNFHALRRYMLMGQGDFYRYLIQLLEPELNKSVEHVYQHNLVSILETAIRATNCQFEDKDILPRLSVNTFEASLGETGWDIFTMVYNTAGPLDTVFQLSDGTYQAMFLFLWQLKRVEYSLSNFRKDQTCVLKKLQTRSDFKELQAMLNTCSLMTAEMVHYVNQVLYYILFEVIECAFENFAAKFTSATTIEEVIHDHELFLQEIKMKTLKDDRQKSRDLSTLMSSLNLAILNLVSYGSQFLQCAEEELARRITRDAQVAAHGTDYTEESHHNMLMRTFDTRVLHATKEIRHICQCYQDNVRKLLVQLSTEETELQLLSTRLDFNEFYKRSEPELSENMKFRRLTKCNFSTRGAVRE